MQTSQSITPRGTAIHLRDGERSATAHIAMFPNDVAFGPQFVAMGTAAGSYATLVVASDERLKPEARKDEARRALGPLAATVKPAVKAVQAERRAIDTIDATARIVEPGNSVLRSEIRADYRAQPMAVQAERIASASFEELAALMEGGQSVSRLPDNLWSMIDQRYVALRHIKLTGLQADFQRLRSLDDITATGPDETAVLAATKAVMERHEARRVAVHEAETSLRTLVPFVALAIDENNDQAFARLMA